MNTSHNQLIPLYEPIEWVSLASPFTHNRLNSDSSVAADERINLDLTHDLFTPLSNRGQLEASAHESSELFAESAEVLVPATQEAFVPETQDIVTNTQDEVVPDSQDEVVPDSQEESEVMSNSLEEGEIESGTQDEDYSSTFAADLHDDESRRGKLGL